MLYKYLTLCVHTPQRPNRVVDWLNWTSCRLRDTSLQATWSRTQVSRPALPPSTSGPRLASGPRCVSVRNFPGWCHARCVTAAAGLEPGVRLLHRQQYQQPLTGLAFYLEDCKQAASLATDLDSKLPVVGWLLANGCQLLVVGCWLLVSFSGLLCWSGRTAPGRRLRWLRRP